MDARNPPILFQFDPFRSPGTDGNKAEIEISSFMVMRLGLNETIASNHIIPVDDPFSELRQLSP